MNCKSIEVADRPPLRDLRTTLRTWMTEQSMVGNTSTLELVVRINSSSYHISTRKMQKVMEGISS